MTSPARLLLPLLSVIWAVAACNPSTDAGDDKTEIKPSHGDAAPETAAKTGSPPPSPKPSRADRDWRDFPATGKITTIGALPYHGAFVGGQGPEGRWVVRLGVDGSSERLDLPGPGELQVVAETPTGELIVGGVQGPGLGGENWFARLGTDGALVSQRTFTTTLNTDDFLGILPWGKGAVMFGSYGVHEPHTPTGWILAVDGAGIDWELRPGKGLSHELRCGVELADGGLMVLGDARLTESDNKAPWLVLVAPDGTPGREVVFEGESWGGIRTAAMGADGLVYAAGNSVDSRAKASSLDLLDEGKVQVLQIDPKGELKGRSRWLEDVALVRSMIARPEPEGGVLLLAATSDASDRELFDRGRELLLVAVKPDGSEPTTRPIEVAAPLLQRGQMSTALLGVHGPKIMAVELESIDDARTRFRWRFADLARSSETPEG